MEKNHFASKGLSIFALVTIISIACSSFILSFQAQYHLAVESGFDKRLAVLIPIIIDLTILGISANAVARRIQGQSMFWSVVLVLIASATSLLFNLFLAPEHLLSGDEGAFLPRWLPDTYVILLAHSVPPLALIAMTETLANSVQAIATLYRKSEPSVDGAHIDDRSALEALEQANQVRIARAKNRKARALRLSSEGKSLGDIASDLNISKKQVRNYLKEGE